MDTTNTSSDPQKTPSPETCRSRIPPPPSATSGSDIFKKAFGLSSPKPPLLPTTQPTETRKEFSSPPPPPPPPPPRPSSSFFRDHGKLSFFSLFTVLVAVLTIPNSGFGLNGKYTGPTGALNYWDLRVELKFIANITHSTLNVGVNFTIKDDLTFTAPTTDMCNKFVSRVSSCPKVVLNLTFMEEFSAVCGEVTKVCRLNEPHSSACFRISTYCLNNEENTIGQERVCDFVHNSCQKLFGIEFSAEIICSEIRKKYCINTCIRKAYMDSEISSLSQVSSPPLPVDPQNRRIVFESRVEPYVAVSHSTILFLGLLLGAARMTWIYIFKL